MISKILYATPNPTLNKVHGTMNEEPVIKTLKLTVTADKRIAATKLLSHMTKPLP